MATKIGDKELALRAMREKDAPRRSIAAVVAELPKTSGVKPVKKKRKAKTVSKTND